MIFATQLRICGYAYIKYYPSADDLEAMPFMQQLLHVRNLDTYVVRPFVHSYSFCNHVGGSDVQERQGLDTFAFHPSNTSPTIIRVLVSKLTKQIFFIDLAALLGDKDLLRQIELTQFRYTKLSSPEDSPAGWCCRVGLDASR